MIYLLEIARGFAALWVFLFHCKDLFEASAPRVYEWASHGHYGVPMFFVVSGYVIAMSAESAIKGRRSPWQFLKNRFMRIYPSFWCSIIVVLCTPYLIEAISMLKSGHYNAPVLAATEFSYGEWIHLLLLSKVFFAESSDLQSQFTVVNAVYWTLAIEFQFYLVVFVALWRPNLFKFAMVLVSVAAVANLLHPLNLNAGLFIHFWHTFAIGMALAYLHLHGLRLELLVPHQRLLVWGTLVLATGMLIMSQVQYIPQWAFGLLFATFLWGVSPLENVLVGAKVAKQKFWYWALEPILALGAMSYTVYLLHGKIYQFANMFVRQVVPANNMVFGWLTVVLTLLLCWPFYYYIERRFISKRYAKLHQQLLARATP